MLNWSYLKRLLGLMPAEDLHIVEAVAVGFEKNIRDLRAAELPHDTDLRPYVLVALANEDAAWRDKLDEAASELGREQWRMLK